jgi:hypothetical protein
MDWQLLIVLALVALALLYLSHRAWLTWRGKSAGCGSCRCAGYSTSNVSGARTLIPVEQVKLRLRSR